MAEATREQLLRVATQLFAERGYAGVGTELIAASAGLTRGALYHHFRDKRGLFRAVHERLEEDLVARVGEHVTGASDPVGMLTVALRAFLDSCEDPVFRRIALLEAPTVLGWVAWREVSERRGLGLVMLALQLAMDGGAVRPQPVRPLAHLLLGALGEAAHLMANATDPARARREVEPALLSLLPGFPPSDPSR